MCCALSIAKLQGVAFGRIRPTFGGMNALAPVPCLNGPCDGREVPLPAGVGAWAFRDRSGTWHRYRLTSDDSGLVLRYTGPLVAEPPGPLDLPHEVS